MREIRFRAWDPVEKIMAYNVGFSNDDTGRTWWREVFMIDDGSHSGGRDWIPMQFTGLKDKNGKEIYEGDIVHEDCSNPNVNWTYEVYYDNEEAKFWCRNSEEVLGEWNNGDDPAYPRWNNYEVIGNIYENPELLNGQTRPQA